MMCLNLYLYFSNTFKYLLVVFFAKLIPSFFLNVHYYLLFLAYITTWVLNIGHEYFIISSLVIMFIFG